MEQADMLEETLSPTRIDIGRELSSAQGSRRGALNVHGFRQSSEISESQRPGSRSGIGARYAHGFGQETSGISESFQPGSRPGTRQKPVYEQSTTGLGQHSNEILSESRPGT